MQIDNAVLIKRLEKPKGSVDVVLDTDTYNEIDDQFALAYLVKSAHKLNLKAIYAAPFHNRKSTNPKNGMELSYNEILRVLGLMKRDDLKALVHKGSERFMRTENEPVISEAAKHLIELADGYSAQNQLYVIAVGAITNIASALLMKPEIQDKIVIIWLGGHALEWSCDKISPIYESMNEEFNMKQDISAARVVFGCGVPLVQLPCMGVVSAFTTSGPELEHFLRGKNELCDYLVDVTTKEAAECGGLSTWTRAIWDVAAVGWLLDGDFMYDRLEHSPIPEYDHHYSIDRTRHFIRYVYHINRDALFEDLFRALTE